MKNSYRFFNNKDCKFLPCHNKPDKDEFNCLFCYCPLYFLGDECGGLFENNHGLKDCTNCHLPHTAGYYDTIVAKLSDAISEGLDADIK